MQRTQTYFQKLPKEEPRSQGRAPPPPPQKKWKGKELHAHIKALIAQMEDDDANTFFEEAAKEGF